MKTVVYEYITDGRKELGFVLEFDPFRDYIIKQVNGRVIGSVSSLAEIEELIKQDNQREENSM